MLAGAALAQPRGPHLAPAIPGAGAAHRVLGGPAEMGMAFTGCWPPSSGPEPGGKLCVRARWGRAVATAARAARQSVRSGIVKAGGGCGGLQGQM